MPKSRIRIQDFFSNLPLFRTLNPEQIERLAAGTTEFEAARGTVLCHRGDPCHGLHVVIYGLIKLSLETNRGDEKVVELAGPGMTFGEAAMFSCRPHILAAEAVWDSKLLHITKDAVNAELDADPRFSQRLIAALSDRLYQRLSELEGYFLNSGTERVVRYLLRGENGCASNVECITLPATKGVIASRLNLTQEHFSRILRELMSEGLIEVDGRDVRILNKQGLHAYTG